MPEATDAWQNIGVQGTSVLLLVGAIPGKIVKTAVMCISNYWVIRLQEILIF